MQITIITSKTVSRSKCIRVTGKIVSRGESESTIFVSSRTGEQWELLRQAGIGRDLPHHNMNMLLLMPLDEGQTLEEGEILRSLDELNDGEEENFPA